MENFPISIDISTILPILNPSNSFPVQHPKRFSLTTEVSETPSMI